MQIGTTLAGAPIELPEDAVTNGFAILARRRSGKSTLAGVMEETFCSRGDPWVCLDPVRAHWGIKYRDANGQPGKPSGYDVMIVGGPYGDVPLEAHAGAQLAEILVDTDISCVIDLRDEPDENSRTFVAAFGRELLKINTTPRHVILEEAHEFIPQQLWEKGSKSLTAVRSAMSRLIRNGGGAGIGFTLISQRPAEVAKSVLEQIDNLIILRMSGPNDLNAVKGWFEHNVGDKEKLREILETLPGLDPQKGEAWLCSPTWLNEITRIRVRQRQTYHAGRTPRRGDKPVRFEKVELGKVVEKFREAASRRSIAIEEAKSDKDRIRELEVELKDARKANPAPAPVVDADAIRTAVLEAEANIRAEDIVVLRKLQTVNDKLLGQLDEVATRIEGLALEIRRRDVADVPALPEPKPTPPRPAARQAATVPAPAPRLPAVNGQGLTGLRAGVVKILAELAARHPEPWTRAQLGTLTGFSLKGGTLTTYLGDLRKRAYISEQGDSVWATDAGMAAIGDVPPAPTTHAEAMAKWSRRLRAGCFQLLEMIVSAASKGVDRDSLLAHFEGRMTVGTFDTYLGELRRNGLVDVDGSRVVASDLLFPG